MNPPVGRPFLLALIFVTVLWALLTFGFTVSSGWVNQVVEVTHMLQVASTVVALAVGGISISRWYLTSDTPALWIGVALLLYGAVRLGAAELLPVVLGEGQLSSAMDWVRPAAQIVFLLLLARAATVMPITPISGPKLVVGAIGALVGIAVLLQFVPQIATLVDGAQPEAPRTYTGVNQLGVMPFALTMLALTFSWQGRKRRRWLFTWLGLALFTIALGDVARVFAPPPVEAGLVAKEVMRLAALLLALNGATREILYTYRDSSTRLAQSEYTAMTAEERIRAGQAAAEERAHEARSALAAIEGATKTLQHYRDRLPAETQAALSTAVSGEIRRLQELVSVENQVGEIAAFSLAESLAPLFASERARGVTIDAEVPGDLDAIGRAGATEQVVQTLFDNARRYAAESPVTVRAYRDQQWVVLRIEDRGPGVPTEQREAIFRRGVRGDAALDVPGSGLGLYVAAQLMRDQCGELWVDERPGGGASFAVALPAADASAESEQGVERLDDGRKIPEEDGLGAVRRGD